MLTTQTLLHKKVFGNFLAMVRPLEYRRADWLALNKGRERSVRLILKAMLGVPSAHQGEQEHAMWCFQLPKGSLVVLFMKGGTVMELSAKPVDDEEVQELADFLIAEATERLKTL